MLAEKNSYLIKVAGLVIAGLVLWFIVPVPSGLKLQAWHLAIIFLLAIVGIIIRVTNMATVAIIAMVFAIITGSLSANPKEATKIGLSGFSAGVIWLIVFAFFISTAVVKTGLGRRITYILIKYIGKRTLGLSYGLAITDLILAPLTPSNTARGGGIIYPIVYSISKSFGSDPEKGTQRKIGSYLMTTAFQVNVITSAMFLTAMAGNPLAVKLVAGEGVNITWLGWFEGAAVPGIIALIVMPLFIYLIFPPEIKKTPGAADWANKNLKSMGKTTIAEWISIAVFVMMVVLWVLGSFVTIMSSTTVAILGVGILLVTRVLTIKDILETKGAWNTFLWMGILVMLAGQLRADGFTAWLGHISGSLVVGFPTMLIFVLLLIIYLYIHYFFASASAQIAALLVPFLLLGMADGVPPMLMALGLAYFSNIYASLTQYGAGPAPIFFGSKYVSVGRWWANGFLISLVNITIWIGVGLIWWKVIGLW